MSNPNPSADPLHFRASSADRCDGLCQVETRAGTVDALAEATALHLRMLGRWQPGTLTALLAKAGGR